VSTLKRKYAELKAIVSNAEQIRNHKKRQAEDEYYETTKSASKSLERMLNSLTERAFAIALAHDIPPYRRDGRRSQPDDVWLSSNGVEMRWDADHPNDIIDYCVSFQDLDV